MKAFPIFLDLEYKKVLIIGGGEAAEIKATALAEFGIKFIIVAPKISPKIKALAEKKPIVLLERKFHHLDIEECDIVILAADLQTNKQIASLLKQKKILFCSVSREVKGDFIFPAYKKQGDMILSVSTNGKFPILAKQICQNMILPNPSMLEILAEKRRLILESDFCKKKKKRILQAISQVSFLNQSEYEKEIDRIIEEIKYNEVD